MEDIKANLEKVRGQIREAAEMNGRNADDVLLVAVSKTRTPEEINIAIDAGGNRYRREQGPGDNGQIR